MTPPTQLPKTAMEVRIADLQALHKEAKSLQMRATTSEQLWVARGFNEALERLSALWYRQHEEHLSHVLSIRP